MERVTLQTLTGPSHTVAESVDRRTQRTKRSRRQSRLDQLGDAISSEVQSVKSYAPGYAQVAAFQSRSTSFLHYRRFSYLHSRLLLHLQRSVEETERALQKLDQDETGIGLSENPVNEMAQGPQTEEREALMLQLERQLSQYDEWLLKTKQLHALQKPTDRDYIGLVNGIRNYGSLSEREEAWIYVKSDLVTLENDVRTPIANFVESFAAILPTKVSKFCFGGSVTGRETDLVVFSTNRIQIVANLLTTTAIFMMLIMPMIGAFYLGQSDLQAKVANGIGILVTFTVLFAAILSIFLRLEQSTLFTACAAYFAVIVIFVSNFANGNFT